MLFLFGLISQCGTYHLCHSKPIMGLFGILWMATYLYGTWCMAIYSFNQYCSVWTYLWLNAVIALHNIMVGYIVSGVMLYGQHIYSILYEIKHPHLKVACPPPSGTTKAGCNSTFSFINVSYWQMMCNTPHPWVTCSSLSSEKLITVPSCHSPRNIIDMCMWFLIWCTQNIFKRTLKYDCINPHWRYINEQFHHPSFVNGADLANGDHRKVGHLNRGVVKWYNCEVFCAE